MEFSRHKYWSGLPLPSPHKLENHLSWPLGQVFLLFFKQWLEYRKEILLSKMKQVALCRKILLITYLTTTTRKTQSIWLDILCVFLAELFKGSLIFTQDCPIYRILIRKWLKDIGLPSIHCLNYLWGMHIYGNAHFVIFESISFHTELHFVRLPQNPVAKQDLNLLNIDSSSARQKRSSVNNASLLSIIDTVSETTSCSSGYVYSQAREQKGVFQFDVSEFSSTMGFLWKKKKLTKLKLACGLCFLFPVAKSV